MVPQIRPSPRGDFFPKSVLTASSPLPCYIPSHQNTELPFALRTKAHTEIDQESIRFTRINANFIGQKYRPVDQWTHPDLFSSVMDSGKSEI